MSLILGIDTSNYTTSASLIRSGEIIANVKIPVGVAEGGVGVRQSDAVFSHVKNLSSAIEKALGAAQGRIDAIGVSTRPRSVEGSYMPCFLAGATVARSIAAAMDIPLYEVSHQDGHVAAALYSCRRLDILEERFIAFHVSGGTTEMLLCDNFSIEKIGGTVDLTAGQAIDRTGVMMGLAFPCGPHIEKLAYGIDVPKVKVCVNGLECNLSGLQNKTKELFEKSSSKEETSAYLIEFIRATLDKLTENALKQYGDLPVVFAGGVMSNSIIRESLSKKYGAYFADPAYSADNACGVAVLAEMEYKKRV